MRMFDQGAQCRCCCAWQAPVAGELPVMLPEKLQKFRMIAEMESVEGGATDLTGDSGLQYWGGFALLLAWAHGIAEHSARTAVNTRNVMMR
jgi:hypothetical protein